MKNIIPRFSEKELEKYSDFIERFSDWNKGGCLPLAHSPVVECPRSGCIETTSEETSRNYPNSARAELPVCLKMAEVY